MLSIVGVTFRFFKLYQIHYLLQKSLNFLKALEIYYKDSIKNPKHFPSC